MMSLIGLQLDSGRYSTVLTWLGIAKAETKNPAVAGFFKALAN